MHSDARRTGSHGPRAGARAVRDAALLAGVSLDHLRRTHTAGRASRPMLIGAGLLVGGAVVALAHLAGADLRGVGGGQPGLLMAVSGGQDPTPR
jgi:hypothetical protein